VPRTIGDEAAADGRDEDRERIARRRRTLATWHTVHIPLTWALFAAAFIHVVAALYYATLQR
jgi:cytochrome b561